MDYSKEGYITRVIEDACVNGIFVDLPRLGTWIEHATYDIA